MHKTKKWMIFLGFLLVFSVFLASCSNEETTDGKNSKGDNQESKGTGNKDVSGNGELAQNQVLHLSSKGDIPSLDIHHASDPKSFASMSVTRAGLIRFDENGNTVPDMAASPPKVSKNKKVYTFKIREDAVWSDGEPVTAQNFVYSWHRELDPKTSGEYAYIYPIAGIKNAAKILDKDSAIYGKVDKLGIKALDKKTLQVTLEKPTPYFLDLMTFAPFFPLRKDIVEKYGDQYATEPNKLVYNGEFILSNWDHGEGWTYKKNPKYWNADEIKLKKVEYKVVKQLSTSVDLYKTGKLDYTGLNSQFINQFKDSEGFHTKATATIGIMRLNRKREALTNDHIRDALYNAFSRKKLTKFILKDGSEPAFYFVPKNFAKGPEGKDFRVKYPTINKMSDKEMMAAWKKGLEEIGKDSLTFELMIRNNSTTEKVGTFVASQLEKNLPGLTININKQPSGQFLKLEKGQQYDISLSYWIPDYKDPMTYLGMWVTGNSANRSGYSNSKYDALIQKAKHLGQKPKKRWEIMQKAEKVLLEDVGFIPVYQYGKIYVQKPYIKHITQRMLSDIDWTRAKVFKH